MKTKDIIASLDDEIARLQTARALIAESFTATTGTAPKRRIFSAEGRERIAAAQRKRWAKAKNA